LPPRWVPAVRVLMTTAPALIAACGGLPIDEAVLLALTTWARETIRPARLFQGNFTFLLGSVEAQ